MRHTVKLIEVNSVGNLNLMHGREEADVISVDNRCFSLNGLLVCLMP